jgi:hypothetical protein
MSKEGQFTLLEHLPRPTQMPQWFIQQLVCVLLVPVVCFVQTFHLISLD